jgi:hypothetical protein
VPGAPRDFIPQTVPPEEVGIDDGGRTVHVGAKA